MPAPRAWTRAALAALAVAALGARDVRHLRAPVRPASRAVLPALVEPAVMHALRAAFSPAALTTLRGEAVAPDGAPLAGVRVVAVLAHQGHSYALGDAVTDAAGTFSLAQLPPGRYTLLAHATGRARAVLVRTLGATATATATASPVEPARFVLGPGVTVSGTLVAPRDAPIDESDPVRFAGLVVQARPDGALAGEAPPFAARADLTGAFVLEGLAPGTYRIEVRVSGYEHVVRRAIPAPVRDVRLVMRALASIRGRVTDLAGAPAPSAEVRLAGSGVWPARAYSVQPDGSFAIEDIPGGVYELRAHDGSRVAEPIAPLVLRPGASRDVQLFVGPGLALRGSVVDAASGRALEGAEVLAAEDALSTDVRAQRTDTNGAFTFTGLLRRPHQLSARARGYVPRVAELAAPGAAEPAVLRLDRAAELRGRVVDGAGNPVANAQIDARAQDLDGRVQFLSGTAESFRSALFDAQLRGPRAMLPGGELGVTRGPVPNINVALTGITRARAATDAGVTDASALASATQPAGSALGFVTDAQGRFLVRDVPPGVVRVAATHPAFVRGESAERAVRAGETLELELVLHAGGSIVGRLTDERGFPLSSQLIELRAELEPAPRRVFTARDGTFRVPAVLGRVAVLAVLNGRIAARAEVTVADGVEVTADLSLAGAARRIHGRVVDGRAFAVAGAEVTAGIEGPSHSGRAISGDDGYFDLALHGNGPVTLSVRHPEYAPRTVRAPAGDAEVTVTLEGGGGASVLVDARSCAGASEITVELRTPCGPLRRGVRNGQGEVRFEHLCAGRVSALASAAGCVRAERSGAVTAGRTTDLGRLDLSPGGSADGEVLDAHNEVVAGAVVALASLADTADGAQPGTTRADRRGLFHVTDLPDGDQQLVAMHPLLGRTQPATVRVLRGTTARGIRLRFSRDMLRAQSEGAPRDDAAELGVALVETEGRVEVRSVRADSPPAGAGLQPGDALVSVQGAPVRSVSDALARMRGPVGDEVRVEVERDGTERTLRWVRSAAR